MRKEKPNLTHDTVPASVGLVKAVRDELRADIRAVEHGMNSKFEAVNARFDTVDSKFEGINSRFEAVDSKFAVLNSKIDRVEHSLTSKFEQLSSDVEKVMVSVHRTQVLMEEQRGENRIVLDGLKTVIERQDRIETDFDELRDTVRNISAGAKR